MEEGREKLKIILTNILYDLHFCNKLDEKILKKLQSSISELDINLFKICEEEGITY